MKRILFITLILAFVLTFGCSKQYIITNSLDEFIPVNTSCNIGSIGDELPSDFPDEKKPTYEDIEKFRMQLKSALQSKDLFSIIAIDNPDCDFEVTGAILDFKAGSGAVRFFIGFGAGSAKVTVNLNLVNKSTGEIVFAGNFIGSVSSWAEGGFEMFKRVSKNFAKALEKELKRLEKEGNEN